MKFTKMHGIGNDYIYVNGFEQNVSNPADVARRVSDRHFGIGSDGLILIVPSDKADVRMRMFNADGSEGEMCGNGVRCVAKYAFDHGLSKSNPMKVETGRGVLRLDLKLDDRSKVEQVTVDSRQVFNEIVEYLKGIAPDLTDRVKLYEDVVPLFDKANIEHEIRDLFKRRCDLPSGGYLIIEPTEALVSIDVNSGRYTGKKDPEKTILKTNLEAAREVARQLRLRDIGGIIVCDFIDMETKGNRDRVLQELRAHLGRDRARTKAFAVSDLGLVEMTRQRVRQSHLQNMTEPCPTCHGTGRVFTAETIIRRVERSIRRMGVEGRRDHLVVKLHPDVAMYVLETEKDLLKKLEKLAGFALELRDDPLLRPDEFKLVVKSAGRDVTQQYAVA